MRDETIKSIVFEFVQESSGLYAFGQIINILTGSLKSEEKYEGKYFGILPKRSIGLVIKYLKTLEQDGYIYSNDGKFYVKEGAKYIPSNIGKKRIKNGAIEFSPQKYEEYIHQEDNQILKEITNDIQSGKNLFITGHAGTGKSYILNRLKEIYPKLVITSTTGIAAVNVNGQTLHSWAGIGLCRLSVEKVVEKILSSRSTVKRAIKHCKKLAIDEISMLNKETLEYVDKVFKLVRDNDKPFGGIQVIFIGDFFQLPPVSKEEEEISYCFESPVWQELNLKTIILTKNYRQNEENFIKTLSDIRTNKIDEDDIKLLKSREVSKDNENMLHIFSTNQEAENYNLKMFNAIDSTPYKFVAKDEVAREDEFVTQDLTEREKVILEILNQNCRVDKIINLKVGCRVMLLVNMDFKRGLINGSCGEVTNIKDKVISVRFDNGETTDIVTEKFECYYNDKVQAVRKQFPLRLAYGITIHKSQGMTLDNLYVDCKRIFERGQAYVALSRLKTLNGLYLKNFSPSLVMTDPKVVEFYRNLDL